MISSYLRYILIILLILALCNIFMSIDQKIIEGNSIITKDQVIERINFLQNNDYFSLLETFFNEMMVPEIFKIDYFEKQSVK